MSVENSAETTEAEQFANTDVGRRRFMQGVGVATVAAVGMTGSASAEVSLDYEGELAPETELRATAVREEVDLSDVDSVLTLSVDDEGEVEESLLDDGMSLRESFDPDGPAPSNVIGVPLDGASGVDRELLDGDLLDPANWVGDGILTDTEEVGDGEPLSFEGAGVETSELVDDSDEPDPVSVSSTDTAQLLFSSEVAPGSTAEVRLVGSDDADEPEEVALTIDPDGDDSQAGIVSVDESVSGAFAQVDVPELSEELVEVDSVEVELTGAETTLDVFELGEREVVGEEETDDGTEEVVETEPITSNDVGLMWVPSLDALGDRFEGATLSDVEVEVSQLSRDLSADEHYTEEVEVPEEDQGDTVSGMAQRLRAVSNHYAPDDVDGITFDVDDVVFWGVPEEDRYEVAGYSPDESTTVSVMSEALDLTLSSVVEDLSESDREESRHVSDVEAYSVGDRLVTVIDVGLTSDELDDVESSGFFGGGFGGTGGDGFLDGARSVILVIAGIVGGAIGWVRSRASSAANTVTN